MTKNSCINNMKILVCYR